MVVAEEEEEEEEDDEEDATGDDLLLLAVPFTSLIELDVESLRVDDDDNNDC